MNQYARLTGTRKTLAAAATLACAVTTASTAMADPVLWEVQASSYDTTVSGSFVYDADTNVFSDIDIKVSSGYLGLANEPLHGLSTRLASNARVWYFTNDVDYAQVGGVRMSFELPAGDLMTNAGGAEPLEFIFTNRCYSSNGTSCTTSYVAQIVSYYPGHSLAFTGTPLIVDEDDDGVADSADLCPGTVIPEAAPTSGRLGHGRHALTIAGSTDFTGGDAANASYSTADTGGCSCEQIVDTLSLGKGQLKFGCSNSVMEGWVSGLAADPNTP